MGDLTLIKPKSTFQGFESMSRVRIPLVLEYWSVQETDNMPVSNIHICIWCVFNIL